MTGKEDKESKSSDKKKDPNPFSPENVQETMGNIYNAAVGGIPGASITVEQLAEEYRERYSGDVKRAARELANSQIAKCGLTGFVTGLGGLATLPVALPADVAGVLLIQLRMISAIATLGG